MWNTVSCSKLTEQRERRRVKQLHRRKLKEMRPMLHIEQPERLQFLLRNDKKALARRLRQREICDQNQLLLHKIENCFTKHPSERSNLAKFLNLEKRRSGQVQIYEENKRICDKLLKIPSHYPTHALLQKADQQQKVKINISFNARRTMRPATTRTQFYRSRPASSGKLTTMTDILKQNRRDKQGEYKERQEGEYKEREQGQQREREKGEEEFKMRPETAPNKRLLSTSGSGECRRKVWE